MAFWIGSLERYRWDTNNVVRVGEPEKWTVDVFRKKGRYVERINVPNLNHYSQEKAEREIRIMRRLSLGGMGSEWVDEYYDFTGGLLRWHNGEEEFDAPDDYDGFMERAAIRMYRRSGSAASRLFRPTLIDEALEIFASDILRLQRMKPKAVGKK